MSSATGSSAIGPGAAAPARPTTAARIAAAWAFVGVPLVYGIYETVKKASALF